MTGSTLPIAAILRAQLQDNRRRYSRRRQAQASGHTDPLDIDRDCPVLREAPPPAADRRVPAPDNSPCPRCQTRGDLGCKHFAPCEKEKR